MNELSSKISSNSFHCLRNKFWSLKDRQFDNIETDDLREIQNTDQELEAVFKTLLQHDNGSHSEKLEKIEFLLDMVSPANQRSAIEEKICNRIIEICTSL